MAKKDKNIQAVIDTVLNENEEILSSIFGAYETVSLRKETIKSGVLVATNERVIFYGKRITGYDLENFQYDKISSFELSKKIMGNVVTFYASGNKVKLKWINDKEVDNFIQIVNEKIKQTPSIEKEMPIDNLQQLKTLKELLDMGAITQEEFDEKKLELF